MPKDDIQKNMENGYRPSLLCIEDPLNPGTESDKMTNIILFILCILFNDNIKTVVQILFTLKPR